jgi:hypothetical protein
VALRSIGDAWTFLRKVEELLTLHKKVETSLEVINERLRALEDRLVRMESGQTQFITEARSAATTAATMIAGAVIADVVTRVTRLEGRAEQLEQQRLSPP